MILYILYHTNIIHIYNKLINSLTKNLNILILLLQNFSQDKDNKILLFIIFLLLGI